MRAAGDASQQCDDSTAMNVAVGAVKTLKALSCGAISGKA